MAGNLRICVLAAAGFLLLFLWAVIIMERYKYRLSSFWTEKFPFLRKVHWDTVIKGFVAAGFILFVRKVLYYIGPFFGIIQTPSSIWWADIKVLAFLCCTFFLALTVEDEKYLRYFFSKEKANKMAYINMIIIFAERNQEWEFF